MKEQKNLSNTKWIMMVKKQLGPHGKALLAQIILVSFGGKNLISTKILSRTTLSDPNEYSNHINLAIYGFITSGFYVLMLINEK